MARIVFSITAAQVKALLHVHQNKGESRYSDYGTTSGIAAKGWIKAIPKKSDSYWRTRYKVTKRGRVILALIHELKLDRQASGPEEGGP